ncbi:MAG: long-subunit fatty acid transport protein [Gammaproteobacteria bacterium]|jgi:long-subunit fatty acid transport protein
MKPAMSRPVLFLLLCSLFVFESSADQLHYNNILIGNRAAGLGGAYSAISDDASGLYYNPAGIVFSNTLQLSASANAVHSSTLTYKNVLNGEDWTRETSSIVPNFFGMTSRLGKGYFGFSYAVTDFEVEDQDTRLTNVSGLSLFIINIKNTDKVTKLGPSYAIKINDQWNVGATLYMHDREKDLVQNQFIRLVGSNQYESSNLFFETVETGIEPILGFIWTPHKDWSIGGSLRQVTIVSSTTRVQNFCASDVSQSEQCLPVAASVRDPTIESSTGKRKLPVNIRLGVAYFPSPQFLVSADISHFGSVRSDSFNAEEVLNFAVGLEYYINATWAIRGGYFTNLSNTPEIDSNSINQTDHVDLTGISFSATKFSKTSSITVGYSGSSGSGEAQVIAGSNAIQDLDQSVNTLYLSTSYSF